MGSAKSGRLVSSIFRSFCQKPKLSLRRLRNLARAFSGASYAYNWEFPLEGKVSPVSCQDDRDAKLVNPLQAYFDANTTGPGIWKWDHYFEIYHRHLKKFIGKKVHVIEIGIYSGGSLGMWRHYFGENCRIYGIDINDVCRVYEDDRTKVFIGNQGDRSFWKEFKAQVPQVDIVIDDGGHHTDQQIVTLEEILPHIRPGGVYVCEDLHGPLRGLNTYLYGFADRLNADGSSPEGGRSAFHNSIKSVHFYPRVIVIEKHRQLPKPFISRMQGTEWQPIYRKINPPTKK